MWPSYIPEPSCRIAILLHGVSLLLLDGGHMTIAPIECVQADLGPMPLIGLVSDFASSQEPTTQDVGLH